MHTPELLDLVRKDWRADRPLVEWVVAHSAGRDSASSQGTGRTGRTACRGSAAGVNLAIVRSGSQKAFIDGTRPSSSTT